MTNEEAIERLKEGEPFSEIYNKDWEETKYLSIKALEKQIPKKLNKMWGVFCCPECGYGQDEIKRFKYCQSCGQALEWGEK